MNISAKSVVEAAFLSKPPPNIQPPGYQVCWLRTATSVGGDTFVGKIGAMRFDGNHLTLWLSSLARVLRFDKTDNLTESDWKCLALVTSVQLEFDGCCLNAEESKTGKVTFKSSTDDTIVLSNEIQDIREAEELFSPA